MTKFVQITTINDEATLINIDYIEHVTSTDLGILIWTEDNNYFETETYDFDGFADLLKNEAFLLEMNECPHDRN